MNAFRPDLTPGQPIWLASRTDPAASHLESARIYAGRSRSAGFARAKHSRRVRDVAGGLGGPPGVPLLGTPFGADPLEGYNVLNHANFADPAGT